MGRRRRQYPFFRLSTKLLRAFNNTAVFLMMIYVLAATNQNALAGGKTFPKPSFNAAGELIRPDIRYREWVFVGTPLTPNELNPPEAPFPEFHNVYIHPDDFDHWKNTGTFPDGTVIVKELVTVGSKKATSGNGYFMGEFTGLEVTIKDSKLFKNDPGNWAYFSFGHAYPLAQTSKKFPVSACNVCHENSAADDFVFTQYYPVLRAAKAARNSGVLDQKSRNALVAMMTGATDRAFQATAPTPRTKSVIPTDKDKLFAYLGRRAYADFPVKETKAHPSAGPHTKIGLPVRVYLDPKIAASLKAGNKNHPVGGGIVKEMFDANNKLQGWAVMVKTHAKSDGGKGWFWYEVTSTTDGSKPVASGNGVPLCFGCHAIGKDFVLTPYPLK
jgi:hypothetical protein